MAARPDFSTPAQYTRAGFARINRGLKLPWDFGAKLYQAFDAAHITADPQAERAAMAKVFRGVEWRWPWLEESAAELARLDIWPQWWTWEKIKRPFEWDRLSRRKQQDLLARTLTFAALRWTPSVGQESG